MVAFKQNANYKYQISDIKTRLINEVVANNFFVWGWSTDSKNVDFETLKKVLTFPILLTGY